MAVNLHTTHFRFGIDELAESTHGWKAAEDTNPAQGAVVIGATFLLRFTAQETGGTIASNTDLQFEVSKNGGAFQAITTTSSIVKAVVAACFANADNTTKRLSGTGTFESSSQGCTEDGLSGGAQMDIAASGNAETECSLQIVDADVVGGDTLTFRLTSPDFTITNDVVPTLHVTKAVEADLAATGVGTKTAVGVAVALALWSSAGVAAVSFDGENAAGGGPIEADLSASGSGTVSWIGAAITSGVLESAGTGTMTPLMAAVLPGTWESTGLGTLDGVSSAIAQSDWTAVGLATILFLAELPAGGGVRRHKLLLGVGA